MIQLSGTYDNGTITLDEPIATEKPVKVLVTFVDEDIAVEPKRLTLDDFSFAKSRDLLKDVKGSISDALIQERRSYLLKLA
jgi:hypothetical protein